MEGSLSGKSLWQNYHFLTKEMIKFLSRKDMELFNELMNQRERLQIVIDQVDDGFKVSLEGRALLTEINEDNLKIIENLQVLRGKSKQQHQVSQAYNAASTTAVSQMNWKR
ncbi:hypothetical protein DP73_06770 [Desulfosporosinus sp. HMP52]|uniref:hypothetical protein n=1 Tax=Desulfosporosinus sp. HMP52 TaxID=1487923 RepID=UPI00051FEC39|nr:hypothetical protein [Desulfosporosinus sp. HMP52]KGK90347.1 hypothetical protein DP73_06770 [Desulfosporosinus sp. HMP52]